MNDGDQSLRLNFTADTATIAEAVQALKEYVITTQQVVAVQDDMAASADSTSALLGLEADKIQETSSGLAELEDSWRAAADAKEKYARIPDPSPSAFDSPDGGGAGSLGKRDIGDVAGIVGLASPGASQALRIGGDIADITKNADKFKEALGGLNPGMVAGGVAAAGFAVVLTVLHNNFEQGKKDAEGEIDARTAAFHEISALTTDELKVRVKALQDQKDLQQADADRAKSDQLHLIADSVTAYGTLRTGIAMTNDQLGIGEGKFSAAAAAVDKTNKALDQTDTEQVLLQQQLALGIPTIADLAQKEKDLTTARLKEIDVMVAMGNVVVSNEEQIAELRRTGSAADLAALKLKTQDEINANTDVMNQFVMKQKQFAPDTDEYNKLKDVIDGYTNKLGQLRQTLTSLDDPTLAAATTLHDTQAAQEKVMEAQAASYEKYTQDRAKADQDFYTAEIAAHDSYMSKVSDINAAAAKQAEDLLEKLKEKRDDLGAKLLESESDDATKLHQTQIDDQIKYQRDVEKLTESHQHNLKQILQDAANQQQELIQNRDFLGLFNLNKTTDQKVQAENDQYAQQRQNLLDNLQQQTDDENRHFAEQEQQRILDYNRQLADAQLQYNRQSALDARNRTDALNKAQQAYTDQLNLLSQKHTQEQQMLRDNEVKSLQLLSQSASQKLALEQQYYTQSIALIKNAVTQAGLSALPSPNTSAGGRGGFSGSMSLTQNIHGGADAGAIADVAAKAAQKTLEQFFSS